ncbi:MAG: FtsQ-type POTRA domain-containing protein [Firmicutes bacterium]|nr:FtsQ-type POTRA domain-containing protein [Bacillota bacterium]
MTHTKSQAGVRNRIFFTLFILIFFIAVLLVVYLRSPFALVKSVAVQGAQSVSPQEILSDSGITVGENLFQVEPNRTQNRLLEDFPILSAVTVTRSFTQQSIVIRLRERSLAGILAADGSLYQILADGTVLDRDPAGVGASEPIITTAMPVSISLGQRVNNPALLSLCEQLPKLPSAYTSPLSELHIEMYNGSPVIMAFTRDGFEVRMPVTGLAASLRLYYAVHSKLVASHVAPGLVDLMSGQEAVYKPFA